MEKNLLTVEVVSAEKFKNYQGFDLANFDHHSLFFDVYTYKIQKTKTYDVFKKDISQIFNIPSKQIRFWVLVKRINKTIRPDTPIPESYFNKSMEEIRAKMTPLQNKLRLYMEETDRRNEKTCFPLIEESWNIIVFLKYFDPDAQTLEGLGHLYVREYDKVGDYTKILCERKNLPPDTPLKIYEVVTVENFNKHQGFDLVNFVNPPLSKIHSHNVLKNTTYTTFKEKVSQCFNIPSEQVRFWVFVKRQNQTIRPDLPIPESSFNKSMEEIRMEMTPRRHELKLYMEVADKPMAWFPSIRRSENMNIIVFLKYFDPDTQTLEGLGHLYVRDYDKVGDCTNILCERKNLPPDTPLIIYEEIKPNMIEKMYLNYTFKRSEIQNGDIICFQKALMENEIREYTESGRICSIPQFYESLTLLTVISFKPEWQDYFEFDLILNKKSTLYQVVEAVALHLNINPLQLQFTNLFDTLDQTLNQVFLDAQTLYYEIFDLNIIESNLEEERFIKILWLGNTVKDEEIIDICLQKDATVNEIIEEILKKVTLSSPDNKIRLYEVMNHKIQNEYKETELIGRIQEFMTLYAEEIPQDEILANSHDQIIQVYHFTKDPIQTHGIPFKFVIKNGETLADIKDRLQLRLCMNKSEFARIRIAIVSEFTYKKLEYLENDDIILSEKKLSSTDYLGLDHVDETESTDKITYIRG
ncbi:ICP0-binding domain of ubiquitin-specific protease 7-domain-containing protein [Rhizophagus diaphanus]|nr:ICP0-binding domain of ubiquitin-specific protease 7-domain-containing protein [Rhizophagus diaphanus] [Rhizophagus sp. MUCL 43196]